MNATAATDDDLLARVRGGDPAALESLLARHAPRIFRFATKMCRDGDEAKDVLQETLIAAARALPEFRGDSSLATWLYTVARSYCVKKRRRSKFAPSELVSLDDAVEARSVASDALAPEEAFARKELGAAVSQAVGELDAVSREVLVLRDIEGLTAPEVGQVLGISVDAVKSRLHRARVALRARLEPQVRAPAPGASPGCPDVVELFSRHLEGEITGPDCDAMQSHVETCGACSAACDSLKRTLAFCHATPTGVVPADVQAMVREALEKVAAEAKPARR